MVKIFCLSDLHLEQYSSAKELFDQIVDKLPTADILILAGDVGNPCDKPHRQNYIEILKLFKTRYTNIILVAGNTEYYSENKRDILTTQFALRDIAYQCGVHFLERDSIQLCGVICYGTTLWTAINTYTSNAPEITNIFPKRIDYLEEFMASYTWLKNTLLYNLNHPSTGTKQIVITHHLPTDRGINLKYVNHYNNSAYYTCIMQNLKLDNVVCWFGGRIHESADIQIDKTRLIVNPIGFRDEKRFTPINWQAVDV